MNTTRNIEGVWWVFESQETPHYGVLHFDPEMGLELLVKCVSWDGRPFAFSLLDPTIKIRETIQGRDAEGRPVTLLGCKGGHCAMKPCIEEVIIHPLRAFIGHSVACWEEARFPRVRVKYSLLNHWLRNFGLTMDWNEEFTSRVGVKQFKGLQFPVNEDVKVKILRECNAHTSVGEGKITETYFVEFIFNEDIREEDIYYNHILVFQRLLTLLTGDRVFVDGVTYMLSKQEAEEAEGVELLIRNKGVTKACRSNGNVRAPYPEIESSFPMILKSWYECHDWLESVLNLYYAVVFNPALYQNHRFLLFAQALEVYHASSPKYIDLIQEEAVFKKRRNAILASVDKEEERIWLKKKLHYANKKELSDRLKDLLETHKKRVQQFIDDAPAFEQTVRWSRNYYTHYDPKLKDKVPKDSAFNKLVEQMRLLLEICILDEIGIREKAIDRGIAEFKSIRYISLRGKSTTDSGLLRPSKPTDIPQTPSPSSPPDKQ